MFRSIASLMVVAVLFNSAVAQEMQPKQYYRCTVPVHCDDTGEADEVEVLVTDPDNYNLVCSTAQSTWQPEQYCTGPIYCGEPYGCEPVGYEPPVVCCLPWKVRYQCCGRDGRLVWATGEGCSFAAAYREAQRKACYAVNRWHGGASRCWYHIVRKPCHRRCR